MWAHSDLDYDGGLVLISIAHQPTRIITSGAGLGKVTTRPKMKG
jgi:hypothetical protein